MGESTLSPYSPMAMIHTAPVTYYEGRKGVVLKKIWNLLPKFRTQAPTERKRSAKQYAILTDQPIRCVLEYRTNK